MRRERKRGDQVHAQRVEQRRVLGLLGEHTVDRGAQLHTRLREVAERWQARAAGPRLLHSPEWCGTGPVPPAGGGGMTEGGVRR